MHGCTTSGDGEKQGRIEPSIVGGSPRRLMSAFGRIVNTPAGHIQLSQYPVRILLLIPCSLGILACSSSEREAGPFESGTPASSPVLLAAGDIATCGSRADEVTATLIEALPGIVATLGDNAYQNGSAEEYAKCYEPTWGRFKDRTHPAPGNHDYATSGAAPYYAYFGAAAGDPAKGYYSYELGSWHIVVLNSNCAEVGGCGADSPQERWLRSDLSSHPNPCTLSYWHHPRFSSGQHGSDKDYRAFWRALYEYRAELVLNGHDHDYERFAPQDPDGNAVPAGVREFVLGTGGAPLLDFAQIADNSLVRRAGTHGVLKLRLNQAGYDWEFLPEPGSDFRDSGSAACH